MNTETCILVSIRWNKNRSHTEKKNNNKKTKKNKQNKTKTKQKNKTKKQQQISSICYYCISVFKYINNKLKGRNIVVRGNVTISKEEQNDTCTRI